MYQHINSTKSYLLVFVSPKLYVYKQSSPTPQNSLLAPSKIHAQAHVCSRKATELFPLKNAFIYWCKAY